MYIHTYVCMLHRYCHVLLFLPIKIALSSLVSVPIVFNVAVYVCQFIRYIYIKWNCTSLIICITKDIVHNVKQAEINQTSAVDICVACKNRLTQILLYALYVSNVSILIGTELFTFVSKYIINYILLLKQPVYMRHEWL